MYENDERRFFYNAHVLLLLDCSDAMRADERIEQLNCAVPEMIMAAREAEQRMECTNVLIRAIAFNDSVRWVLGDKEHALTPEEALAQWQDLTPQGNADTAAAIEEALTVMQAERLGDRFVNPMVILISAGKSSNRAAMQAAVAKLRMALTDGYRSLIDRVCRVAIGVRGYNREELEEFAVKGTLEDVFGHCLNNQPLVFRVDEVGNLPTVMTRYMIDCDIYPY